MGTAASSQALPQYSAPAATQGPSGNTGALKSPNNQAYDSTFFQDYGVNPRIDTEDDRLSTFALDVDTGSYTIMRSYIDDGSLPPKDSVRVEEYVNYFDQGYPYPPEGQAFGIYVDGAPSPFVENENYKLMRIGIQGYAVPAEERPDVSLTFVIDVSGSMNMDNRLGLVKRSLELLTGQLRSSDRVSIVVFGTQASIVLEPTSGDHQQRILHAIYSLHPGGVTNAEAGLLLGYQMAVEAFNPEGINRVILCSDGVANMGETGAGSIWEEIKRYAGKRITLTTVGFGMDNYNDVLMEQLADNGNGFYAYVDEIEEARRIFVENLTSTLQVIAMNAKVQVDFNPQVVSRYRLVGFENRAIADQDFRDDRVDAGEVGAGRSVTALYEIKLDPEAYGKIATVYLRWKNPASGSPIEMSQEFYTDQMSSSFNAADPHFQWSAIVAEYAEVLRGSYWAETTSLYDVQEEVERVSRRLPEDANVEEFVGLVHRASRLGGE
jgi:Ca-activated chloride channel family protein